MIKTIIFNLFLIYSFLFAKIYPITKFYLWQNKQKYSIIFHNFLYTTINKLLTKVIRITKRKCESILFHVKFKITISYLFSPFYLWQETTIPIHVRFMLDYKSIRCLWDGRQTVCVRKITTTKLRNYDNLNTTITFSDDSFFNTYRVFFSEANHPEYHR